MKRTPKKTYSTIQRGQAERYILTSLIAFATTVIITRAFLQLTGFPQIGNSVLYIAHANDYFYPPALPLIYGFILLNVLVYQIFRRRPVEDPHAAMYHALEGLQNVVEGDLDAADVSRIETRLSIARQSDRAEIVSLANALSDY